MSLSLFLVCSGLFFLLGAILGSFLGVVIYRLPRDISLLQPERSFCPHCEELIPWWHNLPIVSWVALGGRAGCCNAPIGKRVISVEVVMGFLSMVVFFRFFTGFSFLSGSLILVALLFFGLLVAVSFIDAEHSMIPDELSWGGVGLGLVLGTLVPSWFGVTSHAVAFGISLLGATLGFLLLWSVMELGKRCFGKKKVALPLAGKKGGVTFFVERLALEEQQDQEKKEKKKKPFQEVEIRLTYPQAGVEELSQGEAVSEKYLEEKLPFEELLARRSDKVLVRGFLKKEKKEGEKSKEREVTIMLSQKGYRIFFPKNPKDRENQGKEKKKKGIFYRWEEMDPFSIEVTELILPQEAMGFGDVKWLAAIGAFVGWQGVFFTLVGASFLGALWGSFLLFLSRGKEGRSLPFGPFLSGGAFLWVVAGSEMVRFYFLLLHLH